MRGRIEAFITSGRDSGRLLDDAGFSILTYVHGCQVVGRQTSCGFQMEETPRRCPRLESVYGQIGGWRRVLKAWQEPAVVHLSPPAVSLQTGLLLVSEHLEEQTAIPFAVLHTVAQALIAVTSMLPSLKSLFSASSTRPFAIVFIAASCCPVNHAWGTRRQPMAMNSMTCRASGTGEFLAYVREWCNVQTYC